MLQRDGGRIATDRHDPNAGTFCAPGTALALIGLREGKPSRLGAVHVQGVQGAVHLIRDTIGRLYSPSEMLAREGCRVVYAGLMARRLAAVSPSIATRSVSFNPGW